jgi:CubicO group peptidase (beta-lactamase class C family)
MLVQGTLHAQLSLDKPYLDSLLSATRSKYYLPAIGVAIILEGKLKWVDVDGVRKYGDTTQVTVDDKWHIGSDTKAMTATMIARLVEMGKLNWSTTISQVFPELKGKISSEYDSVTVEMLLCHRAGLLTETWPSGMSKMSLLHSRSSEREQRYDYVKQMLADPPRSKPGTKFEYANAGFIIAGAIAERVMDSPYADLMQQYVFGPLGMSSVGYGPTNTEGKIDQPWAHSMNGSKHVPMDADPTGDNPPVLTPAGRVHLSLADWAKFAIAHLDGEEHGGILQPSTYRKLHSLPFGGEYGFGWGISTRSWAKGTVLTHNGSNGMNFATLWLAPKIRFGVLVVTNQGDTNAEAAVSDVVTAVVTKLWIK